MRNWKLTAYLALGLFLPFYLFLTSNRELNEKAKHDHLDSLSEARQVSINNSFLQITKGIRAIDSEYKSLKPNTTISNPNPGKLTAVQSANDSLLNKLIRVSISNNAVATAALTQPKYIQVDVQHFPVLALPVVDTSNSSKRVKPLSSDSNFSNYDLSAKGPFSSWIVTIVKKPKVENLSKVKGDTSKKEMVDAPPYCYYFELNNTNADYQILVNRDIEQAPTNASKPQFSFIDLTKSNAANPIAISGGATNKGASNTSNQLIIDPANQSVLCLQVDKNLQSGTYYFFISGNMVQLTKRQKKQNKPFRIPIILTVKTNAQ